MQFRRSKMCAAAAATIVLLAPIKASALMDISTGLSAGVSVGTDGIGTDVYHKLNPFLVGRGGFRYADFSVSRVIDDVDYTIEPGFTSGVIGLDLHPLTNGLRLSAGTYIGKREMALLATPAVPVEIGGQTFTPQQIGSIDGHADYNNISPFVGIGFNNSKNAIKRFGFQAMLGVMHIGRPDVTLASTGGLFSNDPIFLSELANEEDRLRQKLDDIRFYPIINLGFSVRF